MDFKELVIKGRKARVAWLTIDYLKESLEDGKNQNSKLPRGQIRYGLSISKKIGSAVIRNRIKRWTREFLRKMAQEGDLAGQQIKLNVRLRENGDFYKKLQHSDFDSALGKAWVQIRKAP